jgi:hypothetical protein
MRAPGPLRLFGERVGARCGSNVAVVAVARKLLVITWDLLTRDEEYAFARPSLVREKVRMLELLTRTGPGRYKRGSTRIYAPRQQRELELELARQAELAYARLVKDWQPAMTNAARPRTGAAHPTLSSRQRRKRRAGPLTNRSCLGIHGRARASAIVRSNSR